jgi:hypothetical protein
MDQPFGSNLNAPTALAAPQRNQYFYGKLLDVPHLQLEQEYFNSKRWLINLLLHGAGVISGLAVTPNADGSGVVIQSGVALDGWGREIIVPAASVAFDPRALTDDNGNPTGTQSGAGSVIISLCYQECGIDPAPVLVPGCEPAGSCASSSTREQYVVTVKAGTVIPLPVACTFNDIFKPDSGNQLPNLHAALAARVSQPYTDGSGAGCVVLAQVNLPASGAIDATMIDNSVRPVVVSNALLLELLFCLAKRVQDVTSPSPTPTPAPTPTPTPTPGS